jgi:hypothetical protein
VKYIWYTLRPRLYQTMLSMFQAWLISLRRFPDLLICEYLSLITLDVHLSHTQRYRSVIDDANEQQMVLTGCSATKLRVTSSVVHRVDVDSHLTTLHDRTNVTVKLNSNVHIRPQRDVAM